MVLGRPKDKGDSTVLLIILTYFFLCFVPVPPKKCFNHQTLIRLFFSPFERKKYKIFSRFNNSHTFGHNNIVFKNIQKKKFHGLAIKTNFDLLLNVFCTL